MIQPNYGNLLGFSQAENIMRDYNDLPDSVEFSATKRLESKDKIRFPLIYPELEDYFPKERETLCLNESFSKYQDIKTDHLLVVSRCENGKNALAYYERGKLKLATYVSIGKPWTKTITGSFPLKHSAIFRRSRKYKNAAMPYALHIKGGYFLHQGRSDGKPRSHWCVRVPGLHQKRIYEHLPKTTPDENSKKIWVPTIILEGLYTPTLSPLHSKKKDSHTETTSFQ